MAEYRNVPTEFKPGIVPQEAVQQDRDTLSIGFAAVAASGSVLLIKSWDETAAALGFLGPDGQEGREAYVSARNIQTDLVSARDGQDEGEPFARIVNGILADSELQDDVVALTNEPLSDNTWLTPNEEVAVPLQGIAGLMIAVAGVSALAARRFTRGQAHHRR